VNAAGGSIVVETAPGVGSIFKIYLKIESDS
jgi:signal transduction histidine kinase